MSGLVVFTEKFRFVDHKRPSLRTDYVIRRSVFHHPLKTATGVGYGGGDGAVD